MFKIPLLRKIDDATFYFLIFLLNIWSGNSISIPVHPGIMYFWICLFSGAAYQKGEEAEAETYTFWRILPHLAVVI